MLRPGCSGIRAAYRVRVGHGILAAAVSTAFSYRLLCRRAAVAEEPLDGKIDSVQTVGPVPEALRWLGSRRAVSFGVPVSPQHMPTRWRFGSKERDLPGFMGWGLVLTVSEAFREIIERFEPGRHQFFPLDDVTRKGEPIAKRYLLVIGTAIDTLNRARSGPGLSRLWRPLGNDQRNLLVDRAKVAGRHLWYDHFAGHNNSCFVSHVLARALVRQNPKQLTFQRYPLN